MSCGHHEWLKKMINDFEAYVINEFEPAGNLILWADNAIGELKNLIESHFKDGLLSVVTNVKTQTVDGKELLKVHLTLPREFARKATEALNNSKNSFDQSVFTACNVLSGQPKKKVYYPWAVSPEDLEGRLKRGQIDPRLWDTIRSHEPYPTSISHSGGDSLARTLASIVNKKHSVGFKVSGLISNENYPLASRGTVSQINPSSIRLRDDVNEFDLVLSGNKLKSDRDVNFLYFIHLHDDRLSEPIDVIFALDHFNEKARKVLNSLKIRCIAINHEIPIE